MRSLKASSLCVLAGTLLCGSGLLAQRSNIGPRITSYVDESSRTTLKGNVPRLARAEFDQGEADAATQLTQMRLVLSRSDEQQAALDTYLAQLQDQSSPNYHKWLTPQQFGQLYGPADSDIAALIAWLESHGFQVEPISAGRTNIAFSGSVIQVEAAFHTFIHSYQAADTQFYSNTTDPQIPSALASVVKGIAHLNTIPPRPHSVQGTPGHINAQTGRPEPASAASATSARPELTETSPSFLYIVPGDAATIYDTPNSFNANFSTGTSYTGAGVHIGIGGDASIYSSIVQQYRIMFIGDSAQLGLNYCTSASSCANSPGSGYSAGDADEAYLDTELAGGLAPGASITYYASPDLSSGIEAAINQNTVDIFSLSFGECEHDNGSSINALINGWWEQAAGQGIAVTVSAGDNGSAGCDLTSTKTGNNVPNATGGLAVSGYASTPYNIAVGGTDFYALETQSAFSSYVGATTNYRFRSALSYIPESVWNDSAQSDTQPLASNVPLTGTDANIVAGSGGVSTVYNKPAWQTGTGVPSDGKRDLPDISLMSGNGADNATWLVCTADTAKVSGIIVTENCVVSNGSFYFTGFGGTSTAAPAFAGILALVEQKTGSRLGQAAQQLYALYNSSHATSVFHDVVTGNNSVPCVQNSTNCALNTAGNYFETGYNAVSGYDLASGLGSVDVTQLVNYWNSSTGSAAATITVNASPNPVASTASLTVTISVSGSSGTPTGTVTLSSGGYTSGAYTLGSGTCTAASCVITVPAGSLVVGTDTLTVTYSGNSTYATKTNNSTTVTVTGTTSTSTFALTATNIANLTPGATTGDTSTVTATTTNGYTGTVTVTCALTNSPSGANTSYLPTCTGPVPTTPLFMSGAGSVFTINTTAVSSAALAYPKLPGKVRGLLGAGSSALLAMLLFFGIPARRRSWRSMIGILVLLATLGSLSACGGGGTPSSTNPPSTIGTSAGTYTFTITGTGNDSASTVESTTFTVTVN